MEHEEVFAHLKKRVPIFVGERVVEWTPLGPNTIRFLLTDGSEFAYSIELSNEGIVSDMCRLSEFLGEEHKPYERNYPYEGHTTSGTPKGS